MQALIAKVSCSYTVTMVISKKTVNAFMIINLLWIKFVLIHRYSCIWSFKGKLMISFFFFAFANLLGTRCWFQFLGFLTWRIQAQVILYSGRLTDDVPLQPISIGEVKRLLNTLDTTKDASGADFPTLILSIRRYMYSIAWHF